VDSYEDLKLDKKITCEAAITSQIKGYKLLYPREIYLNQIDKVNLSKELLLSAKNLIQKETFVFYENPLAYNFQEKTLGCSKKKIGKKFGKLYPGLPNGNWP